MPSPRHLLNPTPLHHQKPLLKVPRKALVGVVLEVQVAARPVDSE